MTLRDGYTGSTLVSDFAGPKITLRYATTVQAEAAHALLCGMIDAQPLASTAATQPEQALPECVATWFRAEQASRAAVDAHNAAFVEAAKEPWPGRDIDAEYQAMNAAQNRAHRMELAMFDALAIPASTARIRPEQADEVLPYTEAVAREAWGIVCNSRRGLTDAAHAAIRDARLNPLWHASSPASTAASEQQASVSEADKRTLPDGFTLAPVQMSDDMREYLQDRLHSPICKADVLWKVLLKMGLGMEDE